jgi:long-subunit fatty acid transport protein
MMNLSRKTLIGTFALVATLSAPLAFAQSQTDTSSTDASAQQSSTGTDASAQGQAQAADAQATTSNDASAAQGDPAKKSWADVDANKDGNLSKAEASAVPALGQVFDKADANADGSLTADEYKTYVSKSKDGQK